jgi:hypothetical protein
MLLWNSLSRLIRHPASRRGARARGVGQGRPRCYRPRVEMLEGRTLLSVFAVDHLADDMVGSGLNGSLRYCITNATDGDSITFGVTGTINLTGVLPGLTHSISIQGPGANSLSVHGGYNTFSVRTGATVSISGLTVANGAGIENTGTLTISSCTISSNHEGISNQGTLTLNNATVSDNGPGGEEDSGVGGIVNDLGRLTINNSTISHNHGISGFLGSTAGGIRNYRGTVSISYSTIAFNQALADYDACAGIFNENGTVTISNSTIANNYTTAGQIGGGGILNWPDGTLTITNSTISGNTGNAGGIASGGTLTMSNSTIANNVGFYGGGGLSSGGPTTISNSTIASNSSFSSGGGIRGTINMQNTILAGNGADRYPDLDGSLSSSGYNLIGNTSGGSGFDSTDLLNVNPLLGPLQDNGGPTKTMALLAGSPALNAGDPAQLGVADQRGVVRTGGVNIGAYQASASTLVVTVPDTVTAGTPFDVTVQAVDPFGQVAFGYTGTVSFSVTDPDPAVVLPLDYTFTAGDQGTHTFTGGFTLITPGMWTLTVADLANGLSKDVMLTVTP